MLFACHFSQKTHRFPAPRRPKHQDVALVEHELARRRFGDRRLKPIIIATQNTVPLFKHTHACHASPCLLHYLICGMHRIS
jgi:hypothetical protein